MALVVIRATREGPLGRHLIDGDSLYKDYPQLAEGSGAVLATLRQVWDREARRVTLQPNRLVLFPYIRLPLGGFGGHSYALDVTGVTAQLGVPIGSFVELVVSNVKRSEDLVPAFPGEIRTSVDYQFIDRVKKEVAAIERYAEAYETIGLLYQRGWTQPASDVQEALVRLDQGDFEGSILAFRRVIETVRATLKKGPGKIRDSDGKTEATAELLNKAFHLLSASGLHSGTVGLREEAVFAREVTIAASRYVASTLV